VTLMSTPGAAGVAQDMRHHISSVSSFNQWSPMASPPMGMDPTWNRHVFAGPLPGVLTPAAQTRGVESSSTMETSRDTGTSIIQYLHQQDALNRNGKRRNESNGCHGMSGLISPQPLPISQDVVIPPQVICSQLPAVLSCSTDEMVLTQFQVFLRQHIEAFAATPEDVSSRVRGRHKQIRLHQVGIQCRHCAHIAPRQRGKGAVYSVPFQRMPNQSRIRTKVNKNSNHCTTMAYRSHTILVLEQPLDPSPVVVAITAASCCFALDYSQLTLYHNVASRAVCKTHRMTAH
jgi:hypothetical protein